MATYTKEVTEALVAEYKDSPTKETVKAQAERLGVSPVSVRSKLVAEGVYISAAKSKGEKASTVKKSDLAAHVNTELAAKLGTVHLESLEYMRKDDLEMLASALAAKEDRVA